MVIFKAFGCALLALTVLLPVVDAAAGQREPPVPRGAAPERLLAMDEAELARLGNGSPYRGMERMLEAGWVLDASEQSAVFLAKAEGGLLIFARAELGGCRDQLTIEQTTRSEAEVRELGGGSIEAGLKILGRMDWRLERIAEQGGEVSYHFSRTVAKSL